MKYMNINESRKAKLMVNTLFGVLDRICNVLLSFILRTVFIRTLGIQYTGVSALFTDILTVFSFAELGIATAISTALYGPLKSNNEEKIRILMKFYKTAYRYIAAFIFFGGLLVTPFLKFLVTDVPEIVEDIRLIYVFFITKSAISYLWIYKSTLLTADQKQYQVTAIETACTIIRYIVGILVLILYNNYILYLIIEIVFTVIQNLLVTKRVEKLYPYAFEKTENKLSKEETKGLFRDVKGLAMYKVSATVGNSVDNVLISSMISTVKVGLLSNYSMIRKNLEIFVGQFFIALTPSVGNIAAEKNDKLQLQVFNRIYYMSFLLVNFCSCSLLVLYNPFIDAWLGEKYTLDNSIPFIIAFDFFLYVLLRAVAAFRNANGLFVKGQYRPLVMAIMNVCLSIVFIKHWGIFGTILATAVSRLLTQWYDAYILFKCALKSSFRNHYIRYWLYIILFIFTNINP